MADGNMFDHDALGRSVALYDQARETFAETGVETWAALARAERATLAIRAHRCGWDEERDGDLVAWSRRRAANWARMFGGGVHV